MREGTTRRAPHVGLLVAATLLASAGSGIRAQEGSSEEDLAKQLANPISSLISVPFQNNYEFDVGPDEGFRYTLNVQPVIPFDLTENWNLISRTIVPIVYQAGVLPGAGDQFGFGDTVQSLFFSPKRPTRGGLIWGVGPAFLVPTATEDPLGADQWAAGPTAVLLTQRGPWTYGVLLNHLESTSGDDGATDVDSTFVQPFLGHTKGPLTITANFEATYDHQAEQWTLPANLAATKVTKFGNQLVSWGGGIKVYANGPDGAPSWGLRLIVTLLYPR